MYLGIYLKKNNKTNKQKKTKQIKTGKKKKEKKEGRKNGTSRTRARHFRLVATLPNHYTTKADYVIVAKGFLFSAFSPENPPANAVKDDRAA